MGRHFGLVSMHGHFYDQNLYNEVHGKITYMWPHIYERDCMSM